MIDDFEKVAEVSEVPQGTTKIVIVGEVELFVANVEGSFYALPNKCTHMGGPLGRRTAINSIENTGINSSYIQTQ
jgi:3-phenylpropionate/trans-cinnamate dioxygenase ferredoxin subunit